MSHLKGSRAGELTKEGECLGEGQKWGESPPLHDPLGKWVGHPTFTSSTQGIRVMNQGVKNRENKEPKFPRSDTTAIQSRGTGGYDEVTNIN